MQFHLPVLGPQVDFRIWEYILAAGKGPVTGLPAETAAVMQLRQMPSPFIVANGRNINVQPFDAPMVLPGR